MASPATRGARFVLLDKDGDTLVDAVLGTNLRAPWLISCEFARRVIKAKQPGRIVNISSMAGFVTHGGGASLYAVTKTAVNRMTEALASEWASFGINVNCIAPGFIASPMTDVLNEKQTEEITKMIPAQRYGTSEEVAACALYLASVEAGYITGQTIHINGGMAMV